ncbi:UbiA family prenyltransferase [Salinibacterium sp. G-O1]|uniref:UbiA family prenyltransferase n=1 Tax=Salinibacterium sp. G-O1 TaxID=3046208 RepID=UPI0024BAC93B|nr:UbiA family prenyltransferase [Salinibacterium sp. G-O1]MDJ0335460.1 UbiA family prenyltransferase [Salinibacterium sp. G-O1]
MLRTASALARSTHPGPTVAVTAITVILGAGVGLSPGQLLVLGLAFLLGQASVGLSNDWIDADRDRAVARTDKPVAAGQLDDAVARNAAIIAAIAAVALTLLLGPAATVAHAAFIGSAWAYNVGLKSTWLSALPYVVSFGLLPLIVTLARSEPALASPWALIAGSLLGVSAHFANVLPDLDDDRATGVRGLPHRLGRRTSGFVIAGSLAAASTSIVVGPGPGPAFLYVGLALSVALAALCAVLLARAEPTRLIFRLIIAGALVNVLLLALSGERLLA